jgi:hypothetical protein
MPSRRENILQRHFGSPTGWAEISIDRSGCQSGRAGNRPGRDDFLPFFKICVAIRDETKGCFGVRTRSLIADYVLWSGSRELAKLD